jgi:hypothetical protein
MVHALTEPTSFDFRSNPEGCQFFIGVFFSPALEVLGIIQVKRTVVKRLAFVNRNRFSFRWNPTTAADDRVKRLFWTEQKLAPQTALEVEDQT